MPGKKLGIDIGDGVLNAVIVHHVRGGYRVDMAESIDVSGNGGISGAIDELRDKVDFRSHNIRLSLPAAVTSFHNLKMPFREEKKIRQTIAYELETLLPYGIDDCLLDYNIISQARHSLILSALVSRLAVKERISLFGENPPSIGTITIGALPVASLLSASGQFIGSGLLLDIGAREAVAVFVVRDKIVQVRHFAFGSNSRNLCSELANTVECLKWDGIIEEAPDRIFLTGPGSQSDSVTEDMARFFSLPTEVADLSSLDGIMLPDEMKESWKPHIMNQALALAVHEYKRGQGFNFPLLEAEKRERQEQLGKSLKWGTAVLSLTLFLLGLDNYLDHRYAKLRLENLKKEISAVFKSAAPEVSRMVDPVQQFKVKIAEMKKISAGTGGMEGSAMVLDILKDLSTLVPPSTEFLITGFNLDEDRLVIKGTAKNFDAVDTIKKELANSSNLRSVQIGTTSTAKQGDKVEFDLRITVQR